MLSGYCTGHDCMAAKLIPKPNYVRNMAKRILKWAKLILPWKHGTDQGLSVK